MDQEQNMPDRDVYKLEETLKAASNDYEKIASMILAIKILKKPDISNEERRRIFEAISFRFIKQLMQEGETSTVDFSKQMREEICVTVLSHFVAHGIVSSQELGEVYHHFLSILQESDKLEEDLVTNVYRCLDTSLDATTMPVLLELDAIPLFCNFVIQKTKGYELAQGIIAKLVACVKFRDSDKTALHELVEGYTEQFTVYTDDKKFEAANDILKILNHLTEVNIREMNNRWPIELMSELKAVISIKNLDAGRVRLVIQLGSQLMSVIGIEDFMSICVNDLDDKALKFFRILFSRCVVEITLLADHMEQLTEWSDFLASGFQLIEHTLQFAASSSPLLEESLSSIDIVDIYKELVQAVNIIIKILNHHYDNMEDRMIMENRPLQLILVACVRLLGAWMSDDTDSLQQDLCLVMPAVLSFCVSMKDDMDIFDLLIPGLYLRTRISSQHSVSAGDSDGGGGAGEGDIDAACKIHSVLATQESLAKLLYPIFKHTLHSLAIDIDITTEGSYKMCFDVVISILATYMSTCTQHEPLTHWSDISALLSNHLHQISNCNDIDFSWKLAIVSLHLLLRKITGAASADDDIESEECLCADIFTVLRDTRVEVNVVDAGGCKQVEWLWNKSLVVSDSSDDDFNHWHWAMRALDEKIMPLDEHYLSLLEHLLKMLNNVSNVSTEDRGTLEHVFLSAASNNSGAFSNHLNNASNRSLLEKFKMSKVVDLLSK